MCEGVLLVPLSCQDLIRLHRRAVMMECERRRSGCRLPCTWVTQRRACTSRASPLMRAQRTRRWLISRTISPGVWNGDATGVLGAPRCGARTRKCSRVGAAALQGFAAQIIRRWPRKASPRVAACWGVGTKMCAVSWGSGGSKLSRTACRRNMAFLKRYGLVKFHA